MAPDAAYEQVLEEVTGLLRRRARHPREKTITYGDLCDAIKSRSFYPQDPDLHTLLSAISTHEDDAGRGLLSAVVVNATGTKLPGDGYFALAELRGRDVSDRKAHHEAELTKVREANRFTTG